MSIFSQCIRHLSYDIEAAERRRTAVRLSLVLLGLWATLGLRHLDSHLSAQQAAQLPAQIYQSDFGAPVAKPRQQLATSGETQQSYTF